MASVEDSLQPLINPSTSNGSTNRKYTESLPMTTINMTSNPTASEKEKGFCGKLKKKRISVKDMFMVDLRRRLASRKELQRHLSFITDIMCFFALFGIVLMIIENEITFTQINDRDTIASWSLKIIITITTIILVVLVFLYHRFALTLYAVNNCADDWHIGLTYKQIFLIALEVIVCSIHPVTGSFPDYSYTTIENSSTDSTILTAQSQTYVSLDVALGLPMFARLYLLCRFIIYHSRLFRDVGSQSLGYLNQVSIDFPFLIKTYLDQWPIPSLLIFSIVMFFIGSWSLRSCDYVSNNEHLPMLDAMWLFIVTYTTVGYGDTTPSTYCGRSIAALIAFIGLLSSALVIAVLAQKLMFDRSEKYVHTFVLRANLAKKYKAEAANVIKYTMKLWIWQHSDKSISTAQYHQLKRKISQSLHAFNRIKKQQRQIVDNSSDFSDMATLQYTISTNTDNTIKQMADLKFKVNHVEEQLIDVKQSINGIQNTLNLLVDTITK